MRFNSRMENTTNINAIKNAAENTAKLQCENQQTSIATVSNSNNAESRYYGESQSLQRYAYKPKLGACASACITPDISLDESDKTLVADDHTIIAPISHPKSNVSVKEYTKSFCKYVEEAPIESHVFDPLPSNILVGMAATDGIGLSTLLSLIARHISEKKYSVALVDADLTHGGLDVLLGLEFDEGRRLQEVDAPLGRCDGYVLCNELLRWDEVGVLAFSPWQGKNPEPWVVEAAIRGLAEACDVVIVDIGAGNSVEKIYRDIPQLASATTLRAVELSVLDLVRFRALLQRLEETQNVETLSNEFSTVGLCPRGLAAKYYAVNIDDASQYLATPIISCLPYDAHLYSDIIGGYGIRNIPSSMKPTMNRLEHWLLGDVISNSKEIVEKYRSSKYSSFKNRNSKSSSSKY